MSDDDNDAAAAGHITSLNPHDVLLGRGAGSNEYIGNQRFRDLIDERREEYTSHSKFEPKKQIAKEIIDTVHSRGGRFLRLVNTGQSLDSIVEEGTWEIVGEKVALEKAKQGLREKNAPKRKKQPALIEQASSQSDQNRTVASVPLGVDSSPLFGPFGNVTLTGGPLVHPPGFHYVVMPSAFLVATGPRPLLYQNAIYAQSLPILQQAGLTASIGQVAPQQVPSVELHGNPHHVALHQGRLLPPIAQNPSPSESARTTNEHTSDDRTEGQTASGTDHRTGTTSESTVGAAREGSSNITTEDEEAFFALAALSVSDLPKFTEEDETREKESLTNEEIADILADMFGKHCNVAHRRNKKVKKDFDRESIDFLINFMRSEIERTPVKEKQALLKALDKCKAEEFSGARLERFLRCEGMNAKLAAQRFIRYWEDRRSVFGDEKFTQRMTISEALRDDLSAIEAGVYVELPYKDASGRQILFLNAPRYSKDVCSPESLLRAYWYLIEKISLENDDISSGYINVCWDRNASVWDYDRHVYDSITRFEKSSWPVRVIAHHICCPRRLQAAIMKPIFFFLTDKRSRSRTKFHEVPENEIVQVLSAYGIYDSMLPVEMGGGVEFDQFEWICEKRAAEMEEL